MPKLKHFPRMPKPDDPRILRRIYKATRKGHGITTAGTLAGLGATTAYQWLLKGQAQIEAGEEQGSHVRFAKVWEMAEARRVDRLGDVIEAEGDKGNWVALMTREERRRAREWGKQQYLEVEQRSLSIQVTLPPGALPALGLIMGRELPQLEEPTDTEALSNEDEA